MEQLAQLTGRAEWRAMAAGAVTLTRSLTRNGQLLPPDRTELTAAGALRPEPDPNGSQPRALAARWFRVAVGQMSTLTYGS